MTQKLLSWFSMAPNNFGQRKYNIALILIASANVGGFAGYLSGSQVQILLLAVGAGYGLVNAVKGWVDKKKEAGDESQ